METNVLILGASLIIILSYLFSIISKKTNVPSVLMLMILGYIIKVFIPVEEAQLLPTLKILGTVGVILIVLEATLDLKLEAKKWPTIWRALVLSLLLLLGTTFLIAGGMNLLLDMTFMQCMLYATPLSVMSSAIIIPSVGGLTEKKKEFLIYESAFSDIFGIVLFYFLLGIAESAHAGEQATAAELAIGLGSNLGLTLIISFIAGYGLIIVFQQIRTHEKFFLLIAVLLVLYSACKLLHLSSLLMILVFGLIINNKEIFFFGKLRNFINDNNYDHTLAEFKTVTLETAFVVRTFFFVAFGLSIILSQLASVQVALISLIAIAAIYSVRWSGLRAFLGKDITPEIYIAPRGLITVLLFYMIPIEMQSEAFKPGILLLTILVTSLVMTYGLIQNARKSNVLVQPTEAEGTAEAQPVNQVVNEPVAPPQPPQSES